MRSKLSIFLLAGNRLFREALARILGAESDIRVAGSAACSAEAIGEIQRAMCDVVLIDPVNGESYDLALVQNVSQAAPSAKMIVIDMVEDEKIFLNAVRTGVVGYVLRDASAADVVAAVRAARRGEAVCPPRLCRLLFDHVARNDVHPPAPRGKSSAKLTRREKQLVPMIGEGLTNKEIASRLNLSEKTIKNHIHNILQRTGASDRYAAAEMAADRNLAVRVLSQSDKGPVLEAYSTAG